MRRFVILTILIAALSLFCCANAESLFYIGSYENETSNGVWNSEHTMLEAPLIFASELAGYTQEQIDYVVNQMYAYGYTKEDLYDDLYEGWSDDESLYVSRGDIEISISEQYADTGVYRVAVFYNSMEYGICASYGFLDTKSDSPETGYYNHNSTHYFTISNQPGLYKDINVVVTGNGMVFSKTFDIQVTEYPSYYGYDSSNDYAYGLAHGNTDDSGYPKLATEWVQTNIKLDSSIPENTFLIAWPVEGSVHSGYDSSMVFSNSFAICVNKNIEDINNVNITLTQLDTGNIIAESSFRRYGWSNYDTHNYFSLQPSNDSTFLLPEGWTSGNYRLTFEIEGMGSHYVDIVLKNDEMNPMEYYEPFTTEKLRILFGSGEEYYYEEEGVWNDDYSVFTSGEYGEMIIRAAGLDPNQKYTCALMYSDAYGSVYFNMDYITESDRCHFFISSKAGTYEDLILILTGNGETIIHPFTCIVPDDIYEGRDGIVFGNSYGVSDMSDYNSVKTIYTDYLKMRALQPKYTETGVIRYNENSILPEINAYLDQMDLIETDAFLKYIRYANMPVSDDLLPSFAILSPNVSSEQVDNDLANPVHTANWAVYEAFSFQQDDAFMYCEDAFIDIQALNTYFGEKWIDLCALEFASGTASDSTGTVYNWMPVYYDDGQGGFHENKLYLFVYITYPGADDEYLAPFNYFNPLLYNEYHTVKLMITDQSKVYEIMNKLRSLNYAFEHMVDTTKYVHLKEGASGEYVRRLQVRLTELGYLTSSVDGEFTPPVTDAVKAYQTDHGLEATGTANAELQKMILDPTYEKQLLLDWLEGHDESKESDKE